MRCIIILLTIMAISGSCSKSGKGLPAGVSWQRPAYSNLFMTGTKGRDSFLALRNPADSNDWLQVVHWGGAPVDGCVNLKQRRRIAAMSSVFTGIMDELDAENMLVAMDNGRYATTPGIRKLLKTGSVADLAPAGQLNREKLLKLHPDLTISYFIDRKGQEQWEQMMAAGLPVVYAQNFLEAHPLGRAEWIKAIGWLLGRAAQAEAIFEEVREHYTRIAGDVAAAQDLQPEVICNAPFQGMWDVPAGGSYMARLITDAGGSYVWKQAEGTGRLNLNIEDVYKKGRDADIWLNPGACTDLACLKAIDSRLALFSAFNGRGIYNSTAITTPDGGNAWWDYAVVRPDLALLDLAFICRPALFPEHKLIFFERLK